MAAQVVRNNTHGASNSTARMDKNLSVALEEKKSFMSMINGDPTEELGKAVKWYSPKQFSNYTCFAIRPRVDFVL